MIRLSQFKQIDPIHTFGKLLSAGERARRNIEQGLLCSPDGRRLVLLDPRETELRLKSRGQDEIKVLPR